MARTPRWTQVIMPKLGLPLPHRLPSLGKRVPEVSRKGDRTIHRVTRHAGRPVALRDSPDLSLRPERGACAQRGACADPSCPLEQLAGFPQAGWFAGSLLLWSAPEAATGPGRPRSERHELDQGCGHRRVGQPAGRADRF